MNESNEKLHLVPPSESSTVIRPLFRIAGRKIPGLTDYIGYLLDLENSRRDSDLQAYCEKVASTVNQAASKIDVLENQMDNKIDSVHVWSSEFFRQFSAAATQYTDQPDEEKRDYLIKFVSNYAFEKRPDVTLTQLFWNLIRDLTGIHLVLLSHVYEKQKHLTEIDLKNLKAEREEALSRKTITYGLGIDDLLFEALLSSIVANGLIRSIPGPGSHEDRSERLLLEPLGFRFLKFLNGDWKS